MKQFSNQKWILSTLLIAALGSQYYFSAPSKSTEALEMASTGAASQLAELTKKLDEISRDLELEKRKISKQVTSTYKDNSVALSWTAPDSISNENQTKISQVNNPVATAWIDNAISITKQTPDNKKTQAGTACDNCDRYTFTIEELKAFEQKIIEKQKLEAKIAALENTEKEKKVIAEKEKEEIDPDETPAERRRRVRAEKREKEEEKKLAKKEKEKDEQRERNEAFEDKFAELSENCDTGVDAESDLECYTSSLGSALSRYTGSKKKRVSDEVVRKVYNEHIAKELKSALTDPENTDAMQALENLMADIPKEYRAIKTNAIKHARDASAQVATQANNEFKLAEEYRRAGKVQESTQMFTSATAHKTTLEGMLHNHYEAIKTGTDSASDRDTFNKYKMGYAREAVQWVNNIMNTSNFSTDGIANISNGTPGGRTEAARLRGGGTTITNPNQGGGSLNQPTFVPSQSIQTAPQMQGTQFGGGRRGGRG